MDYYIGDILICNDIVSNQDRVFCDGDMYKIIEKYTSSPHVKIIEIPKTKASAIHANAVVVTIGLIDIFFNCKRIDRIKKLETLNEIKNNCGSK